MIYFLRLTINHSEGEIMLTTTKYTKELIDMAWPTDSKAISYHMEVNVQYLKDYGDPISDPTL